MILAANPHFTRIRGLRRLTLIAAVVCLYLAQSVFATDSPTALFDSANKAYEEARFSEAATLYENLIRSGEGSAAVFFNLGNAYFKAGQLGHAIAAYRKAQNLAPRDPDIRANLQFARAQAQGPSWSDGQLGRWLNRLTRNEWLVLASISLWLFFLGLSARQLRPARGVTTRKPLAAGGALCVILCGLAATAVVHANTVKLAVITAKEVPVRHGPLQESQNAFVAHDGSELRILDQKDQWSQVSAGPGRIGWVPTKELYLLPRS